MTARKSPIRNKKLRNTNPLGGVRRLRYTNTDGVRAIVPLVEAEALTHNEHGDETNKNAAMDALWLEHVVTPIKEVLKTGFGLGPTSLMITSIFGPLNSRKEEVRNHLIAEYEDIRIFYDGKLMSPNHLLLFATLLNIYIRAPEKDRTFTNCVTIDREQLIVALFGDNLLRNDAKGGRPAHYDKTINKLFNDLRLGSITVTEGGDSKGSIGKGKGYLVNFLRELRWDEDANTFTFAIDYRVANLYALNGHSFIFLGERHKYQHQSDVDDVTLSLQNLYRVHSRAPREFKEGETKYKEVSFALGDLMIRFDALGIEKKAFVEHTIKASLKIDQDSMGSVVITGFSLDDSLIMSSLQSPQSLIGITYDQAKEVISKSQKSTIKPSRRGLKRPVEEQLKELGLFVGAIEKRTFRNDATVATTEIVSKPDLHPLVSVSTSAEATAPACASKPSRHALGLRGRTFDESDTPAYYIRLSNFRPGFPRYETLANENGDYPIYESWISGIENSPAALQAGLCSSVIRANIEKACLWSERNPHRRKTVAQLDKFLSDWLNHEFDKKVGGGDSRRKLTPQERDDQMDAAMAEFLSKRSDKPDEERCVNEDDDQVTSEPSGIVIDADASADLRF